MPSCEKCWRDANGDPEEYSRLFDERSGTPCTPEEQAGPDAMKCEVCNRFTVHQYAHVCVLCAHRSATVGKG